MKVAPRQLSFFLVNGGDATDAVSDGGEGRKFEHEIRHILKAHGFSVVRGAGSKGEFFGDHHVPCREALGRGYLFMASPRPLIEPAIKGAIVFVDGQNLFSGAKEAFGYDYPNYDIQKLAPEVCRSQNSNGVKVRFYEECSSRAAPKILAQLSKAPDHQRTRSPS